MSLTPPLILRLAIAWIAGLLAGFAGATPGAVIAAVAVVLPIARLRRDLVLAALALIALAGTAVARDHRARERGCIHRLGSHHRWVVHGEEALSPGTFPRAIAIEGECRAPMRVAVAKGRARPGAWSLVEGTPSPTPSAIVVTNARVRELRAPGVLARARTRASAAIGRIFGSDAPLARALLVAEMRAIPPELRDRWAAAGLVHMLSISGTHVAIIAAALELLLRALRLPLVTARVGTIVTIAAYVMALGAPAPAVRAATMLGVLTITRLMDRPTSAWTPVAIGALIPLADPATVLDVGWQLSVTGVAALVCTGPLIDKLPKRFRRHGWRRTLAVGLAGSTLATLATAPLVAWHIGRVSLVGPVTNLAAAPFIALAQPALFLALVLAPLDSAARFVAGATHPLLAALDGIAALGAGVPFAALQLTPTPLGALLAAACVGCILAAAAMRHASRPLVASAALAALLAWRPLLPVAGGDTELHVIDVGQGDALGIRTRAGRWILVDAGRSWRGGDAGRSVVVPYVRRRGGRVEAIILTHPHTDHVGGVPTVLRSLAPRAYLDAAYAGDAERYRASLGLARQRGIPWRRVHPGDSLQLDEVTVTVLAPDSAWTASLDDPNEASTVLRVRVGRVRFLLTGDAERGEEGWLLDRDPSLLRADVLKVGHHGSSTSTTPEFLAAVRPCAALVSVGAGNRYGHPSPAVLRELAQAGATVLRTDLLGSVVIRTNGRDLTLEADGERWPCSLDSLPP